MACLCPKTDLSKDKVSGQAGGARSLWGLVALFAGTCGPFVGVLGPFLGVCLGLAWAFLGGLVALFWGSLGPFLGSLGNGGTSKPLS